MPIAETARKAKQVMKKIGALLALLIGGTVAATLSLRETDGGDLVGPERLITAITMGLIASWMAYAIVVGVLAAFEGTALRRGADPERMTSTSRVERAFLVGGLVGTLVFLLAGFARMSSPATLALALGASLVAGWFGRTVFER